MMQQDKIKRFIAGLGAFTLFLHLLLFNLQLLQLLLDGLQLVLPIAVLTGSCKESVSYRIAEGFSSSKTTYL